MQKHMCQVECDNSRKIPDKYCPICDVVQNVISNNCRELAMSIVYAITKVMHIISTKNGVMVHVVTVPVKQVVEQFIKSNNVQFVVNPYKYLDNVIQFAKMKNGGPLARANQSVLQDGNDSTSSSTSLSSTSQMNAINRQFTTIVQLLPLATKTIGSTPLLYEDIPTRRNRCYDG
uniref:Uncharacterized protein n=1 Tax=Onchocerca volvulus TaxID=6282 RepID=A0A8R1TZA7_ONCVO